MMLKNAYGEMINQNVAGSKQIEIDSAVTK